MTSYANIAAQASEPAEAERRDKEAEAVDVPCESQKEEVQKPAAETEKAPEQKEPKKKSLAPAPVPKTSAWGPAPTPSSIVDESKWPVPDTQSDKNEKKGAKFVKPATNKWLPINAKVIMQSSRPQKQNRRKKNLKKKIHKEDDEESEEDKKKSRAKKFSAAPAPPPNAAANGYYNPQPFAQNASVGYPRFRRNEPGFRQNYPNGVGQTQIPPPISPKQDPQEALCQQIDYYFSLENLIRDVFLRKNMDPEGWVRLALILDFKRVKIILNGIQNSGEQEIEKIVLGVVRRCENLEVAYVNGKTEGDARIGDINLRVRENYEQWLL